MKRGGSFMSPELREEIDNDPEYSRCALLGLQFGECQGRCTKEHALIHAGKKVQLKYAIIPCCAAHHGVDFFQDAPTEAPKEVRVWVAVNRATDEELISISKVVNYLRERDRLNEKFGEYVPPPIPDKPVVVIPSPFKVARKPREKVAEMEREARRYARTNGIDVEDARAILLSLA